MEQGHDQKDEGDVLMQFKIGKKYIAPHAIDEFLDMVEREAQEMPLPYYGELPVDGLYAEIKFPDMTVGLQRKRYVLEVWECTSIRSGPRIEIPLP